MYLPVRLNSRECAHVSLPRHLTEGADRGPGKLPWVFRAHVTETDAGGRGEAASLGWFALAWDGTASRDRCVEIPSPLADCLSLRDGDFLVLKRETIPVPAKSVTLQPVSKRDLELVHNR